MYCNEFDTEGLISSPSYGSGSQEEILRMIDLYEQDLPKLKKTCYYRSGVMKLCRTGKNGVGLSNNVIP